jgi:diazepam-binding inhibitor (GABA receptor modulator, acyl-CoA-binding protein)
MDVATPLNAAAIPTLSGLDHLNQQNKRSVLMSDVKKQFEKASKDVTKAKKDPGNDLKLRLYANYKQATEGDVTGDKPGFTDFVGRAKYDAWAKLKGTSQEDAMVAYTKLVKRVLSEE